MFRPFGTSAEDLEPAFDAGPSPHLVTQILSNCIRNADGSPLEDDFFWELSIGKRIELMLTIATEGGAFGLNISLRCSNEACGQSMEIDLTMAEIAELQRRADSVNHVAIPIEKGELLLRKPTGADQVLWRQISFPDRESAVREMIKSLIVGGQKRLKFDSWIETIETVMEDADPLVNASVTVTCPFCEKTEKHAIDLQKIALAHLAAAQGGLMQVVHQIATRYHWGEEQILSLPSWRRARYLEMIRREESI